MQDLARQHTTAAIDTLVKALDDDDKLCVSVHLTRQPSAGASTLEVNYHNEQLFYRG